MTKSTTATTVLIIIVYYYYYILLLCCWSNNSSLHVLAAAHRSRGFSSRSKTTQQHRILKNNQQQQTGGGKGAGKGSTSTVCNGQVLVANRDDGTISVLDGSSGEVLETVELPYNSDYQNQTDPIDVVTINGLIYIGDRANSQVLVLDGNSYRFLQSIPTGSGIIKLATDSRGQYLWVANDGDVTINIIDLEYLVPIRALLPPDGFLGFPNGVVVDPSGDYGYVSFGSQGGVATFQLSDGSPVAAANFTNDVQFPAISFRYPYLYVPSMEGDVLYELDTVSLTVLGQFDVSGPYATTLSPDGQYLYMTLPDNNQLRWLDVVSDVLVDNVTTTPTGPDQLVHTGSRLFVTHPTRNRVSLYSASAQDPTPILLGTVRVGSNPTSLAYLKPPSSCLLTY